jgi:PEGA domain
MHRASSAFLLFFLLTLLSSAGNPLQAATLILKTHPPGSEVQLDGHTLGLSDGRGLLRIDQVSPGDHLLELGREGFASRSFIFAVSEGTSARTLRLEPRAPHSGGRGRDVASRGLDEEAYGSLRIDARGEGIALRLGGASLGRSDEDGLRLVEGLGIGRYRLQASWAGRVFEERDVLIRDGAEELLRLEPPQEVLDAVAPPQSLYGAFSAIALALISLLGAILAIDLRRRRRTPSP